MDQTELDLNGLDWPGIDLGQVGMKCTGHKIGWDWNGLYQTALDWTGIDWTRLNWDKSDWTGLNWI